MDSYYKEIEAIQRETNSIKQKQNQVVFEAERKEQQERFDVEKQKTEIENKIRAAQIQLNNEISHKKQLEKNIESLTAELKIQKNSIVFHLSQESCINHTFCFGIDGHMDGNVISFSQYFSD